MRITYSESFTTVEATAEELRSSRSLSETITSALNNLFCKAVPVEDPAEEAETAEEDEEE